MTNQFLVDDLAVTIQEINNLDFFSLTDLVKKFPENKTIPNWLRQGETIDFLTSWEKKNNPNFNLVAADHIRNKSGDKTFKLSVKNWVLETNAIGIRAVSGKFGGTYAYKYIALEFCMYLSSDFKLEVIEGYEKYIKSENQLITKDWLYNRYLTKEKNHIVTKAVQTYLVPNLKPYEDSNSLYGEEANFLNVAVFGLKHAEWVVLNPELAKGQKNQRDYATVPELLAITSLEVVSATLIEMGLSKQDRVNHLNKRAKELIEQFTKQNIKLIK